jgi:sulfate adenylyltransferase subunit 1
MPEIGRGIDISRGDVVGGAEDEMPMVSQDINMKVCWFNERPMQLNTRYLVCQSTKDSMAVVKAINYKININTLEHEKGATSLLMNDIASIRIRTLQPIVFDDYQKNRITGSLIIVDPDTFETLVTV